MSRHDNHKAHKEAVNALGRELARRSRSSCELCGIGQQRLTVVEVEPAPKEPDTDHALFICEPCQHELDSGKFTPDRWRFLEGLIWSEVPPVQVVAVRVLRRLRDKGIPWASSALDGLYLDEETEAWVDAAP